MHCSHMLSKIKVLSFNAMLAILGLGLCLAFAPMRVAAEEHSASENWVSLPESDRSAFAGIHGGTAPVSVMGNEANPAEETMTGRTGDDFVQLLEGDSATSDAAQASNANAETALVPFGLGETQVAGTDTHARLARAEQDKRDGRSRGAVRLKVDDMKMLNTEQVPVSPESLLQADELTRI